jgi:hypothetical protein
MDFLAFLDVWASREPGLELDDLGPKTRMFSRRIGNSDQAQAQIATMFWQSFMESWHWASIQETFSYSSGINITGDRIVVPRPHLNRFDLLVLEPGFSRQTQTLSADKDRQAIVDGWHTAYRQAGNRSLVSRTLGAEILAEVIGSPHPFEVIITRAPAVEQICVPEPPIETTLLGHSFALTSPVTQFQLSTPTTGTAGIVAYFAHSGESDR